MSNALQRLWANMMPLVGMLLFVALFIVGVFVFSYLLAIAAVVGVVLFVIAFIRSKLNGRRATPPSSSPHRVIEHEDPNA